MYRGTIRHILILGILLIIEVCMAGGIEDAHVGLSMEIPVYYVFTIAPAASLALEGVPTGNSAYYSKSTPLAFSCNNADGFYVDVWMNNEGYLLTDTEGTALKNPLEVSLPKTDGSAGNYQSLESDDPESPAVHKYYDSGQYSGNLGFRQLVDPTREGGKFSGSVLIELSMPTPSNEL